MVYYRAEVGLLSAQLEVVRASERGVRVQHQPSGLFFSHPEGERLNKNNGECP